MIGRRTESIVAKHRPNEMARVLQFIAAQMFDGYAAFVCCSIPALSYDRGSPLILDK